MRLSILVLLVGVTLSFSYAQETTNNFQGFVTNIQQELSLANQISQNNRDPLVIRDRVFRQFCDVMNLVWTETIPAYQNQNNAIFYHPKQSAFIHILCGEFGFVTDLWEFAVSDDKQYFLKDDRRSLGIYAAYENDTSCNPRLNMANCDVAQKFTVVIQEILNDMFDIKQSAVYWGIDIEDGDIKDKVNMFSVNTFGRALCPKNDCKYPKTENRLRAYFKRGENMLKHLNIFDRDFIKGQIKEKNKTPDGSWDLDCSIPLTPWYNIILCGMYSTDSKSLSSFTAMVQNEMFFYRLFLSRYMWWMQTERRLQPSEFSSIQVAESRVTDIIQKTQQQIAWTQEATDLSYKMLREMYATFPIHIGLLIYYEDLYRFRKELVKVVTPLYTLYDKLRNVQDASE